MIAFFQPLSFVSVVIALAATSAHAQQLTGAEIIAIHSVKCYSYTGPSSGTECLNADWTASYNDTRWGSSTGQWATNGDDLCVNWASEPGWDCGPVTRVNANTFTDGEYTWTLN